jgi:putative transcriptional regulator
MKYKSEIYQVVHQDAVANFEVGAISETEMQEFDEMCLIKKPEMRHVAEKSTVMKYETAMASVTG